MVYNETLLKYYKWNTDDTPAGKARTIRPSYSFIKLYVHSFTVLYDFCTFIDTEIYFVAMSTKINQI